MHCGIGTMLGHASRKPLAIFVVAAATSMAAQSRPAGVFALDRDRDREPVVVLDGTWRFQPGDDARWAERGFDDSHWPSSEGDRRVVEPGLPGPVRFCLVRGPATRS